MKKAVPVMLCISVIFGILYWFKCQRNIDLVKNVSLKNTPPFCLLQNRNSCIVHASQTKSELLADTFIAKQNYQNWDKLWMREEGAVELNFDSNSHDDSPSITLTNRGSQDWSLQHIKMIEVASGEVYGFSGWIKTSGIETTGALSVVLYDADKQVKQWHYAKESVVGEDDWQQVEQKFTIPNGIKYFRFRLTGSNKGKAWFDEIKLIKEAENVLSDKDIWTLDSPHLALTIDNAKGLWTVLDKRSSKIWTALCKKTEFITTKVTKNDLQLRMEILDPETMENFNTVVALDPEVPEISYSIDMNASAGLTGLTFPPVLEIAEHDMLVVPLAEGFLFDAKTAVKAVPLNLRYKGGWPLAFIGATDKEAGWMEIVETPLDFELVKSADKEKIGFQNRWLAENGKFGYKRQIRYVFFDQGGYIAMAKRYRQHAKEKGFLKTLTLKDSSRKNNISKLVGAVNVWFWGKGKVDFAKELKASGINKAIFSSADWDVTSINKLGYLTSTYDIYQDVWPPIYHEVTNRHDGWPDDVVLDQKEDWVRGWTIKKGLKEYPGGVICSIRGLERAKKNIPEDLKKNPYTARFIDTTTSTPWRECYNQKHPTSRSADLENKMRLLDFVSGEMKLVTGSEDGVDAAVPFADYFEGMMSPGIGRLPDSGRDVGAVKYMPPTEEFLRFQVGEEYRIPLWELIFHDCLVSTWYWGDSSNRIPELWWKRDLFNILYGNMPLWAIRDWDQWKQYKKRFIESYNNVCPVFEKIGFLEILSHSFITEDNRVQETRFEGDIRIFVNFSESLPFELKEFSYIIPPKGFVVFEKVNIWKEGISS